MCRRCPAVRSMTTTASKNSSRLLSSGLLQLHAVRHVRQPFAESSVHPEHRHTSGHRSSTVDNATTSRWCCVSCIGCLSVNELSTRLHAWYTSLWLVKTPAYIAKDIQLVTDSDRHQLCSAAARTCLVPQTHNNFGDQKERSFNAAGPRVWNSLPPHL